MDGLIVHGGKMAIIVEQEGDILNAPSNRVIMRMITCSPLSGFMPILTADACNARGKWGAGFALALKIKVNVTYGLLWWITTRDPVLGTLYLWSYTPVSSCLYAIRRIMQTAGAFVYIAQKPPAEPCRNLHHCIWGCIFLSPVTYLTLKTLTYTSPIALDQLTSSCASRVSTSPLSTAFLISTISVTE